MIYILKDHKEARKGRVYEDLCFCDKNGFKWQVFRTDWGIHIQVQSHCLIPATHSIDLPYSHDFVRGNHVLFPVTRYYYEDDPSFEAYYKWRAIIKGGWTDDILEYIEWELKMRLMRNPHLTKVEQELISEHCAEKQH